MNYFKKTWKLKATKGIGQVPREAFQLIGVKNPRVATLTNGTTLIFPAVRQCNVKTEKSEPSQLNSSQWAYMEHHDFGEPVKEISTVTPESTVRQWVNYYSRSRS